MRRVSKALLDRVKANLILAHSEDDELLRQLIVSAVDYAEGFQLRPSGYYGPQNQMPPATEQAVVMLASHHYEARDGSTGGFFADNVAAAQQVMTTVNNLLRMNREWIV